jgi:hypothetical protein
MFIPLMDRTVTESKERFSVNSTINCGYCIVWLKNTIIVEDCDLVCSAVSLEPIRNVMCPNTFNLVVLVHRSVLIP